MKFPPLCLVLFHFAACFCTCLLYLLLHVASVGVVLLFSILADFAPFCCDALFGLICFALVCFVLFCSVCSILFHVLFLFASFWLRLALFASFCFISSVRPLFCPILVDVAMFCLTLISFAPLCCVLLRFVVFCFA